MRIIDADTFIASLEAIIAETDRKRDEAEAGSMTQLSFTMIATTVEAVKMAAKSAVTST